MLPDNTDAAEVAPSAPLTAVPPFPPLCTDMVSAVATPAPGGGGSGEGDNDDETKHQDIESNTSYSSLLHCSDHNKKESQNVHIKSV